LDADLCFDDIQLTASAANATPKTIQYRLDNSANDASIGTNNPIAALGAKAAQITASAPPESHTQAATSNSGSGMQANAIATQPKSMKARNTLSRKPK
jgi:hypothetical protein